MHDFDQVRPDYQGPGDNELGQFEDYPVEETRVHPMEQEAAKSVHRKLLQWFYYERDRQTENRLEMAMDADFYDNLQWDPEDAATLKERGQSPLVFNEIAPMVDWLIGTERRTRVDWRVMPRAEDDVQMADIKTKVMKFVSDVNRVTFARSRAFADAVKVGVGWVDDGVRDDPTQDVLYSRYEDWRNVLWDSSAIEHDLSDARYIFRWRWVDEDVAVMMFPDRADKIRTSAEDAQHSSSADWEEESWGGLDNKHGTLRSSGFGPVVDAKRRRVKLYECQYREPAQAKIVVAGPMKGAFFHQSDQALAQTLATSGGTIIDKVVMRVHFAVFTESDMLAMGPSIFRHNRFSLTPIWCYRRSRDRMPYGAIRRVRDLQQDLNKRASKALWLLNTNQIIADEGATEDWEALRDEADRPDGMLVKKAGRELKLQRDSEAANGQVQMMQLDAQAIQKAAGVSQENMGRQTNAVSGEAIKARQLQGSVVTTEPFDNLRLAVQVQGEKQLSLVEQFYTEEKVVRLTGARGGIEWVKINQPEMQSDGSVRYIDDVTASAADFIVSEADYSGTLRQSMFESMMQLSAKLGPELALRMVTIAMEFSDLPNKDDIVQAIRSVTGERDPNAPMTEEEMAQQQMQQQMQQEAIEMQRQQMMLALQEQQGKVREINARAAKLEQEAGGDEQTQALVAQIRQEADAEIERLSQTLARLQADNQARILTAQITADSRAAAAAVTAQSRERVAKIKAASDVTLSEMNHRVQEAARRAEASMARSLPQTPTPNQVKE